MTSAALDLDTSVTRAATRTLPLSLFGIALGFAGLGGAWAAAHQLLNAQAWPDEVLFAVSTAFWLVFLGVYVVRGVRIRGSVRADLQHPSQGPFLAFIPVIGILLSIHYAERFHTLGRVLVFVFVVLLVLIAAQLVAQWLAGGIDLRVVNAGYYLPVVAGPFIASIAFSSISARGADRADFDFSGAALMAFGIGVFFWLSFGTIVMGRHMTGSALPAAAVPSLAVFVSAPATASIAWIVANPGPVHQLQWAFTGVLSIMVLIQLLLIPRYRRLRFDLGFWVFTFPVAATANYFVRFLAAFHPALWQVWAWLVLGVATIFIASIAAASVVHLVRRRGSTSDSRAGVGSLL